MHGSSIMEFPDWVQVNTADACNDLSGRRTIIHLFRSYQQRDRVLCVPLKPNCLCRIVLQILEHFHTGDIEECVQFCYLRLSLFVKKIQHCCAIILLIAYSFNVMTSSVTPKLLLVLMPARLRRRGSPVPSLQPRGRG